MPSGSWRRSRHADAEEVPRLRLRAGRPGPQCGLHRIGSGRRHAGSLQERLSRPLLHGRGERGQHREHGCRPRARRPDRVREHDRDVSHPALLRAGRARPRTAQRQRAVDRQWRRRGVRAARSDASGHRRPGDHARGSQHDHRRTVRCRRDGPADAVDPEPSRADVHPPRQGRRSHRVQRRSVRDRPRHSHASRQRCAARLDRHYRQDRARGRGRPRRRRHLGGRASHAHRQAARS